MESTKLFPEQIITDCLAEMKVDEIGLWMLVSLAKKECGIQDPIQIRHAVIDAVQRLLKHDVVAISYHPEKAAYEFWDMEPALVIARLEKEWDALGRLPILGDGISFIRREDLQSPFLKIFSSRE